MSIPTTIRPILIERPDGGFLAVSPPDEPLRIGVIGEDEAVARQGFEASATRWLELFDAAKMRSDD